MPENLLLDWLEAQGIDDAAAVTPISLRGQVGAFNLLNPHQLGEWIARLHRCLRLRLSDPGLCSGPVLDVLVADENHDAGKFRADRPATRRGRRRGRGDRAPHRARQQACPRGDSRLEDWPDAIWRIVHQKEKDDDAGTTKRYFTARRAESTVVEGRLEFDYDNPPAHLHPRIT